VHTIEPGHHMTGKLVRDEVIGLRTRYIIDLERTADNHVEGVLRRDGLSEPVPFSGWIELLSLLEPRRLAKSEPAPGPGQYPTN
jgi:hypothetical protein